LLPGAAAACRIGIPVILQEIQEKTAISVSKGVDYSKEQKLVDWLNP
jgi:hypothetical protein